MIERTDLTVTIFALRYAANRLSYAPGLVCDYIIGRIPQMDEQQREQMQKEVETIIRYHEYADNIALMDLMKLQAALKESRHGHKGTD